MICAAGGGARPTPGASAGHISTDAPAPRWVSFRPALTAVRGALSEATHCRHVFVKDGTDRIALEVADSESRQVRPELILIDDEGRFSGHEFSGYLIRKDQKTADPCLLPTKFTVVVSLRSDYANRFLMEFGQQKTRLGVDYINLPMPTASDGHPTS